MIAYLEGKFEFQSPATLYVNCNGVGYEVNISLTTYDLIQHLPEGRVFIYYHFVANPQATVLALYGFAEPGEKKLFLELMSVSGVSAATARLMLSGMRPAEIIRALVQGNARLLESIKGIGKKTAERLVVELKDKLGKESLNNPGLIHQQAGGDGNNAEMDAVNALLALGVPRNFADIAVQKAITQKPDQNVEDLIKSALKNL